MEIVLLSEDRSQKVPKGEVFQGSLIQHERDIIDTTQIRHGNNSQMSLIQNHSKLPKSLC